MLIFFRQLANHTAGIRHYKEEKKANGEEHGDHDTKYPEFYIKDKYASVKDSLELFKDDDLLAKPGKYLISRDFSC